MKYAFIVFKKEITDIFRDKKTIVSALVVPLLMIPLMMLLMGGFVEKMESDVITNTTVGLTKNAMEIEDYIENEVFAGSRLIFAHEEDLVDAIKNERINVIIDAEADAAKKLENGEKIKLTVVGDQSKLTSSSSTSMVLEMLSAYNNRAVDAKLLEQGIVLDELRPVSVSDYELTAYIDSLGLPQEAQGVGNPMLMMMLPMLIVMLVASSGSGVAVDAVAGEKERATLEPLLCSSANRFMILIGKLCAAFLFSLISMAGTLLGYGISYLINPSSITMGVGGSGAINIAMPALVIAVLTVLFMGLMFSALQIMLSAYAKSFKEAQTYIGYLTIAVTITGVSTMMMQAGGISYGFMLVPMLNTVCSVKMVLAGVYNYPLLLVGLISTFVYALAAVTITFRMFNRESVLFRS